MPKVIYLPQKTDPPAGGPPYDGDMEARINRLETLAEQTRERLAAIETRLTRIETRADAMATKADVADAKNSVIMWVVSAIFLAQLLPPILKLLSP